MTSGPGVTVEPAREPAARRGDMAWRVRSAVLVVAGLAGLSYAWALAADPLEPYYAAAVRSMSMSWRDFAYGAFDPAGTITVDKLPGAFWVQALAVRAFGLHTWAIVLPQAVEGVLTVLVLFRAVQRLAGPAAGLIAAVIVAVSPATVALNRGNISDSLMILLLVLAADAVSGAIKRGSQWRLVLAAVWVGLAFQAKMIEAWLVLPALGLAYLVGAPGPAGRRLRQLAVAGLAAGIVSLSWMTVVSVLPAAHRPYIDGSSSNSAYQQVFVYNGFGRFGDHTPLQLLAGQSLGLRTVLHTPPPAPARLLRGDLGRDTGWLLPAALAVLGWGLLSRRGRPRGDPVRCCFILWGGWLVILGVTFTVATTINAYYTAVLTPAVAALLGTGVVTAWSAARSGAGRRIGLAALVAGTAGYAAWLVASAPGQPPGWLFPLVIAVGVAALGVAVASLAVRSDGWLAAALAAGLAAGMVAPAVASSQLVLRHQGAFDTPFEPAAQAQAIDAVFVRTPAQVALTIAHLRGVQFGAPYLLATESAALASVFIYASGLEALPIGGFTGTIPSPTLRQLQADVQAGRFHLVLAGAVTGPRMRWIATHCRPIGPPGAQLHRFFCLPAGTG